MSRSELQIGHQLERGKVVTTAVLRAADSMGLTAKRLAAVIGTSKPTVSRMKSGAFVLNEKGKPYELAVLLIRLFRSLDAIVGGDTKVLRQWLINPNNVLGGKPIDKLETICGLTDVFAYLDARRALVWRPPLFRNGMAAADLHPRRIAKSYDFPK